jgi:hypothetical protein
MKGVLAGLFGCVFGIIGIFAFAIVFVPLAGICAIVGLIVSEVPRPLYWVLDVQAA